MSRRSRKVDPLPASIDGARKRLLAKVHILSGELKLSDESYRDVLERVTGHRSAALCEDRQLWDVVKEFEELGAGKKRRAGGRPIADSPMARRCRALWMNLWNLDELEDGSEGALASFVKRQTGKEDMRFCNADDLSTVIEALKDMCSRAGVSVGADIGPLAPRRNLVREQWARLHKAGWARVAGDNGLAGYAHRTWCTPNSRPIDECEAEQLDKLAAKLGPVVRQLGLGRRRQEHA